MTVPVAICELEKIGTGPSDRWKIPYGSCSNSNQKIILKAFDMDADQIQDKAVGLSRLLEKYAEEGK